MSASSPTARIVPSATAVVNGDSLGWKKRMYGSSDVWVNCSVISASISWSQRETTRAGHREPRRRRVHIHGQHVAS